MSEEAFREVSREGLAGGRGGGLRMVMVNPHGMPSLSGPQDAP